MLLETHGSGTLGHCNRFDLTGNKDLFTCVLIMISGNICNVSGSILCTPEVPIPSCSRFKARVVVFNISVPITKGFPVSFHGNYSDRLLLVN